MAFLGLICWGPGGPATILATWELWCIPRAKRCVGFCLNFRLIAGNDCGFDFESGFLFFCSCNLVWMRAILCLWWRMMANRLLARRRSRRTLCMVLCGLWRHSASGPYAIITPFNLQPKICEWGSPRLHFFRLHVKMFSTIYKKNLIQFIGISRTSSISSRAYRRR